MEKSSHHKIFAETHCLSAETLEKYHADQLSAKEKHHVEKHLLECELCSDAAEGFALFPPTAGVLEQLDSKVATLTASEEKTSNKKVLYRVLMAASFVGIVFLSVFIFNKKESLSEGDLAQQTELKESKDDEAIVDETVAEDTEEIERTLNKNEEEVADKQESTELKERVVEQEIQTKEELKTETEDYRTVVADALFKNESADDLPISGKKSKPRNQKLADEVTATGGVSREMAGNSISWSDAEPDSDTESEFVEDSYTTTVESTVEKALKGAVVISESTQKQAEKQPSATAPAAAVNQTFAVETADAELPEEEKAEIRPDAIYYFTPSNETAKVAPAKSVSKSSRKKSVDKFVPVEGKDYKVADYSVEHVTDSIQVVAELSGLEAQFESKEKRKEDEEGNEEKTIQVAYDDILKEGIAAYHNSKYTLALEKFDFILQYFPGNENAYFYSGLCNYSLNQNNKALENFSNVLQNQNSAFFEEAQWYEAQTYLRVSDNTRARKALQKVIEIDGFYKEKAADKLEEIPD